MIQLALSLNYLYRLDSRALAITVQLGIVLHLLISIFRMHRYADYYVISRRRITRDLPLPPHAASCNVTRLRERERERAIFLNSFAPNRIESKHEVTILGGLNEFSVKFYGPRGSKYHSAFILIISKKCVQHETKFYSGNSVLV